ncbi:type II secretion system minor pseudopilin GspI [Ferrimonas lipolytica]|uniref:Type II secretion system protein I n=1 Tax=Ferrimonas lipolytica TaxID=2724191 RepID=A0A6H1UJM1_9GAMM|nr:type II secretion system minor pseudopilin GspI [Ferrimonas lipolytica]QIZ78416.1 type II secretion system minor pseudopilin GspI [Ferrimonas lipolytica]
MRSSKGFTLLEVMVALAIFATAALALINTASIQLGNAPILTERSLANYVVHNRMVDIQLENDFPDIGTKKGDSELAGRTWYWQQRVVKASDEELRMIEVKVALDRSFDNVLAEVQTYVSNPS